MTDLQLDTLAGLAAHALAELRLHEAEIDAQLDEDSLEWAATTARNRIGDDAAAHLDWRHDRTTASEVYAARADLPDTSGWYLRWSMGEDGDDVTFNLHRPCVHGGHTNPIISLADLGEHLAAPRA